MPLGRLKRGGAAPCGHTASFPWLGLGNQVLNNYWRKTQLKPGVELSFSHGSCCSTVQHEGLTRAFLKHARRTALEVRQQKQGRQQQQRHQQEQRHQQTEKSTTAEKTNNRKDTKDSKDACCSRVICNRRDKNNRWDPRKYLATGTPTTANNRKTSQTASVAIKARLSSTTKTLQQQH